MVFTQHDALEYLFTWDRGAGLSVKLSLLRVIMSYLDRNMLLDFAPPLQCFPS